MSAQDFSPVSPEQTPAVCAHMNLLIVIESHCEAGEFPVFLRKLAGQSSELVSQK